MRRTSIAIATALACGISGGAIAAGKTVSWEDIVNDDKTTGDVLTYGLGMKAQRHSPLKQINTKTVAGLVPAWSYSFGGEKQRGQQGQALVHDGVIYITGSYSRMYAVEAKTGKRLWTYEHRCPTTSAPAATWSTAVAAIYGDKVYFGTLDAGMVALNKDTGKVVWSKKLGPTTTWATR
jgi:glucose dehydrogenase